MPLTELEPKYNWSGKGKTAAPVKEAVPPAAPAEPPAQKQSGRGFFDWLLGDTSGEARETKPIEPLYDLGLVRSRPPEKKKPDNEPGLGAKALAYGVIAARQVGNILSPKPQPQPKPQPPPPDPEADRQALIALQARYGVIPLTEVGGGEEAKAIRSQLFHTVPPSWWEVEAQQRAATRLQEARKAQENRQRIREARREIEQLSRAASHGSVISTTHGGAVTPQPQYRPTIIDAVGHTVVGNLLVLATRGKLDMEGRSMVDDRIDVDPSRGLVVYDASKGGAPEVRPWDVIGNTYELKVRNPEWAIGANTVLARAGQRGLDIADLGQVQLVDRQQDEVEVSVPMMGARKFVGEVQRIQGKRALAQERTPVDVPVFTPSDLIPVPREPQGSTPPYTVDTRTIIIAPDPAAFFRETLADTQPIRPFRRDPGVVDNEPPSDEGEFRSMAEFDPTFDPSIFE